ncbi:MULTISPECIES: hypothetical protein [unclassified Micromonospora]|uniref:hypothetical protein n=1 Tax=unclassified Micromonospora TaxID=2617518 RepID=UPI0020B2341A|nr:MULTISPECIES: hypothetical protein [unclassified Micromonospora]MDM4780624.1 hypothetical protein [Micromonospora sp. b486]
MTLEIMTLAQRPDLAPLLDTDFDGAWPPFMLWDPMGALYYAVADELYPEFVFAAVDPAEPGRAVARCRCAGPRTSCPTAAGTG